MRDITAAQQDQHHTQVLAAIEIRLPADGHDSLRAGADARPLAERALAIAEAIYGPDHPNVATALNNLALILRGPSASGPPYGEYLNE